MTESGKMRKSLFRKVLFCALFFVILGSVFTVHAAGKKNIVELTDRSGRYLEKTKEGWCLKDSEDRLLKGVQYIRLGETLEDGKTKLLTGYYYFNSKGILPDRSIVIYQKDHAAGNRVFDGYYYTSSTGRLNYQAAGPRSLHAKIGSRVFNGIYYIEEMGKINLSPQVYYLPATKLEGKTFREGYYYFRVGGKLLDYSKIVYNMNLTSKDGKRVFKGNFYFGEGNGCLLTKFGWYTVNGKKYYFARTGKMYTNCWKGDYYLQADGTMAKNKAVPGGYVDCDGKKCKKEEMRLSNLRKQLEAQAKAAGGEWGIYVKDLKTGDVASVNGEGTMYPASSIKAFVMAAAYDKMNQKKLANPSYAEQLISTMIYYSDNQTYNLLTCEQTPSGSFVAGANSINDFLKKNGYTKTGVHHTLHPSFFASQSDGKGSNSTSAKDGAKLLEDIYRGTCVSRKYSQLMLNKLENHTARAFIPASLPGVRVADKPGFTDIHFNDMAIVYGPKTDYIISIYSTAAFNAVANMQEMSRTAYNYLNK